MTNKLIPADTYAAATRAFLLLISATVWRLVVTLWRSWNHSLEVEPRKKER